MKGCASFTVYSIVVFAAVGYLVSPAAGIPDNAKILVLIGGACAWFLGGGLIGQSNTNTRSLTPEERRRRGDVTVYVFVLLPVAILLFVLIPALAGAK